MPTSNHAVFHTRLPVREIAQDSADIDATAQLADGSCTTLDEQTSEEDPSNSAEATEESSAEDEHSAARELQTREAYLKKGEDLIRSLL